MELNKKKKGVGGIVIAIIAIIALAIIVLIPSYNGLVTVSYTHLDVYKRQYLHK